MILRNFVSEEMKRVTEILTASIDERPRRMAAGIFTYPMLPDKVVDGDDNI